MKNRNHHSSTALFFAFLFILGICTACLEQGPGWTESGTGSIRTVINPDGPVLGTDTTSGVQILTVKRLAFKDLNRNGELDPYEDWRLPVEERASDLASEMTIEQIAGLMLYSSHQAIPGGGRGFFSNTYGGKSYAESGAKPYDLSDAQIDFLTNDNLRHVLVTRVESPETAARWNNNAQALVEGIGLGIPVNNSSDPRHGIRADTEYNAGAGGEISMWPGSLGLAATFDPEVVKQFGEIAADEYRALGITTALSPQIDIATDPRWSRVSGTFGEDPQLSADMARAYIDGFQTSSDESEISGGWGYNSVNAMAKHWPGGGSGEGGRDAHFGYGKYAVYPGDRFDDHLIPFLTGAFDLSEGTGMASAVMPYYTISYNQDEEYGENVGNAYSKYIISDLLREKYGYEGVVCTDWGITDGESPDISNMMGGGSCWGVEEGYTVAERHYKIIMAGVDQFGGNNDAGPIIEAYNLGVEEHGEPFIRERFEQSAVRLLKNIFRVGLFENPYLVAEETESTVGKAEYMKAGYEAQLKSIVMLKNRANVLPVEKDITVYIPKRYTPAGRDWFGNALPERHEYPVNIEMVKKYFNVTEDPGEADLAICFVESPVSGPGYDRADAEKGGSGYVPISLQYSEYTAEFARDPSIAGDERDVHNRTYRGKKTTAHNLAHLNMILETRKAMPGKPVIVSIIMSRPMVFGEFEKEVDAILVNFGVQNQAILDILTGEAQPSALLPMQMPANMRTVEEQCEDAPHDMACYVDSEGNRYDFAFGLNWDGIIDDHRTEKYKKE